MASDHLGNNMSDFPHAGLGKVFNEASCTRGSVIFVNGLAQSDVRKSDMLFPKWSLGLTNRHAIIIL